MATTPQARPLSRLHIGAGQTELVVSGAGLSDATLVMPLGTVRTGAAYFRHDPPAPLEIEHAIEAVEDAIERIRPALPANALWTTADPLILRIAAVAGMSMQREVVLGRDLVELSFNRLAAVSAGRPQTQDPIPTDPAFTSALLIRWRGAGMEGEADGCWCMVGPGVKPTGARSGQAWKRSVHGQPL